MTTAELVQDSLAPLFAKADAEGLWFYCSYQALWLSPQQLRQEQAAGKLLWGPTNWELRNPQERRHELEDKIRQAQAELARFAAEVDAARRPVR